MLLTLLLLAAATPGTGPTSGVYGQLKLAFADGRVSGAFSDVRIGNGTRSAPQFSCAFHLTGAWAGDHADVMTWWPGETDPDTRIPGVLTMDGDKASLSLREDPGGCPMTGEQFKAQPDTETLDVAHPAWIGLRQVKSARARFHAAPGAPPEAVFVIAGDDVAVTAVRAGWVQAEYVDGKRFVRGWIAEADLYPPNP